MCLQHLYTYMCVVTVALRNSWLWKPLRIQPLRHEAVLQQGGPNGRISMEILHNSICSLPVLSDRKNEVKNENFRQFAIEAVYHFSFWNGLSENLWQFKHRAVAVKERPSIAANKPLDWVMGGVFERVWSHLKLAPLTFCLLNGICMHFLTN